MSCLSSQAISTMIQSLLRMPERIGIPTQARVASGFMIVEVVNWIVVLPVRSERMPMGREASCRELLNQ